LTHLSNIETTSVCSYPWNINRTDQLPAIAENIRSRLNSLNKTTKFVSTNKGHVAFLIFELLKIFRALKLGEIKSYLTLLGIKESQKSVKSLLYLLLKFDLIGEKRRGHSDFYFPISNIEKIDLGGKYVAAEAKIEVSGYYAQSTSETERRILLSTLSTAK